MKTAKDLFDIAKTKTPDTAVQDSVDKTVKDIVDSCDSLVRNAKRPVFSKKFSNMIHRYGKRYFYQTSGDGSGFECLDIDKTLEKLRELGFKVNFKKSPGYCKMEVSWDME
jgi:hypothetical protein